MIAIGRIARPHGLQGAVRVTPLTDVPDRFRSLSQVSVEKVDGTLVTLTVESVDSHASATLLKFQGIDSPEQADDLRDGFILIRREDVPPLPEDTFYIFDLIGYDVQTEDGQEVGILSDVLRLPANDAYVVRLHPGRFTRAEGGEQSGESFGGTSLFPASDEVLIPAVRDFVRIDPERKKIIVRGLEELLE